MGTGWSLGGVDCVAHLDSVSVRCLTRKGTTVESTPVEKDDKFGKNDSRKVASPLRVAVRYLDDEVDHERLLIRLVSPLYWFVVSLDDDCWVEDLSARSVRDGPSVVECLVRYEREAGEPVLYRFQDEMSRERLPRPTTKRLERAHREPYYTGTEAPPMSVASGFHCGLRKTAKFCSRSSGSNLVGGGFLF